MRLRHLLLPFRKQMVGGLVLACVTLLANFWLMTLSGWFLAATALAGLGGFAAQNAFNFFTPAASVRFFATLRVGARYAERLVTHDTTFRLLAALRVWFYERLEPLAPAALQEQRAADLLTRIAADIDTLNLFYLRVYLPMLTAFFCALAMAGFFAVFSGQAALLLLAGLALTGMVAPLFTGVLGGRAGAEIVDAKAAMRADYVDALQGMGELLTYGAAPALMARAQADNARLLRAQSSMSHLSGLSLAIAGLATNFTLLAVVFVGGGELAAGRLSGADLPLLSLGTLAAFEAVAPLPQAFQYLGQIRAAARRVFALADLPLPIAALTSPAPEPTGFDLVLDDVSLRYAPDSPWVLRHFSLHVPQGRCVGVVGPTGSGKTTLINLLLRFNEYQAGSVQFGGHDLRSYDSFAIARYVTVISQRGHLFHSSIRDNLLLADGTASDEELWKALEVAQLADFVRAQPKGLDTLVGEAGAKLSGGQIRRVMLARAALRPTPWLVLDEPTEGLDATTEQEYLRDLAPFLAGRTVLCITHRTAPLALMQEVYSLEIPNDLTEPGADMLRLAETS